MSRDCITVCEITPGEIDASALLEAVRSPLAGAAVLFVGSVREFTATDSGERQTVRLHYDAYTEMATRQMRHVLQASADRHGLTHAAAAHRVGTLELSDLAVVVAVSSPHRDASFAAGSEILEQIKTTVPIWKREHWSDGATEWQHPEQGRPDHALDAASVPTRSMT